MTLMILRHSNVYQASVTQQANAACLAEQGAFDTTGGDH